MEMSSAQQNKGVWMEGLPRYYGNEGEPVPSKKLWRINLVSCASRGDESVLHVLWESGVAQDVWAGGKMCMQKCTMISRDIFQLVEDLMNQLQVEDLESFFVQCWVLWNQRNLVVHGGSIQDPARLVQRAKDFLQEYRDAQTQLSV